MNLKLGPQWSCPIHCLHLLLGAGIWQGSHCVSSPQGPSNIGSQMGLTVEADTDSEEEGFEEKECAVINSMLVLMNYLHHLEENNHLHADLQGLLESS